jgi:hypothetical protein
MRLVDVFVDGLRVQGGAERRAAPSPPRRAVVRKGEKQIRD